LQLFDPGNLGFFVQGFGGGRVNDCPFMLEWNGKYELPPKCTTPFALIANFQNGAIERNIVLRATARRKKKGFFGYENFGTPQTAEIKIKVVDTANHIHGMSIPPKCGMLVFQPFFAQGNTEIRSGHGHVVAHEGMQDGTVKSTSYYIPEQPDK
jgi:hypothetical protein